MLGNAPRCICFIVTGDVVNVIMHNWMRICGGKKRALKIEKCFFWSPGLGRAHELQALATATSRKSAHWSLTKRLEAPVCQTKRWGSNRTKVKEVRDMAGRKNKEKPLVCRETSVSTEKHCHVHCWPASLQNGGLMLISCCFLVHTLSPVRLSFNPFLVYNPFIFKMWKLQRSVSTTAPLLFYHFSRISKLLSVLAFSMRDQHGPLF